MMGVNLHASDEVSALIAVANAPSQVQITNEQARIFKRALRHINRAVRIHYEFRIRDLDRDTTPERLEQMSSGVMLVDRDTKVLFSNAWARALLGTGSGLTLHAGRLESTAGSDTLQGLIASCAWKSGQPSASGGECRLDIGWSLRVTVNAAERARQRRRTFLAWPTATCRHGHDRLPPTNWVPIKSQRRFASRARQ